MDKAENEGPFQVQKSFWKFESRGCVEATVIISFFNVNFPEIGYNNINWIGCGSLVSNASHIKLP